MHNKSETYKKVSYKKKFFFANASANQNTKHLIIME